jgi:glycosyltransferase involved in cell wall biosynthesis
MIKVAHFVSFGIGGADRAALELIRELTQKLPEILICYGEMSFPIRTADQDPSQELLNIFEEYKSIGNMQEISNVSEFANLGIDILHTHRSGEDEWLIPGLSQLTRNFKVVETNFHGFINTPADFRIFPSLSLPILRKIKLENNTEIIPNLVNSFQGKSLRTKLGISEDGIVFGRVGRSDRSIYSPKLLKHYSKIQNETTTLLWIGKSEWAIKDAESLGVENVIWVDPVSNPIEMANYYATFDVFCHANPLGETFGNTVAEAMLRGLPVASIKGNRKYPQAQRELLDETQFSSSPREFSRTLKNYRDNSAVRIKASERNLRFSEQYLVPEVIAGKVLKVYERVLS